MIVDNCIRQEKGYCRIQWQGADTNFQIDTAPAAASTAAGGGVEAATPTVVACALGYVKIPDGSQDGVTPLNALSSLLGYQNEWCGSVLGYTTQTTATSITCKSGIKALRDHHGCIPSYLLYFTKVLVDNRRDLPPFFPHIPLK